MQVVFIYDKNNKPLQVHSIDAIALIKTGKYFSSPQPIPAPPDAVLTDAAVDQTEKVSRKTVPLEQAMSKGKDDEDLVSTAPGEPQIVPVTFDRHFEHHENTNPSEEEIEELKKEKIWYVKPESEKKIDEKERKKKS